MGPGLVFTRTKYGADKLVRHLLKDGLVAKAIHGDKSQNARTTALREFKEHKLPILVATDIAARGLDIEKLPIHWFLRRNCRSLPQSKSSSRSRCLCLTSRDWITPIGRFLLRQSLRTKTADPDQEETDRPASNAPTVNRLSVAEPPVGNSYALHGFSHLLEQ